MKTLALELSSSLRSAALVEEGRVICRAGEDRVRAQGPAALINDVLRQAGVGPKEILTMAIGIGPGSYTGIRVAIAIAQGWALALGVRLFPVSSVEAVVWRAWLEGNHGNVTVLVDAQRGEFYAARYRVTETGIERREELSIRPAETIERWAREGEILVGPDVARADWGVRPVHPDAGMVGVLASDRTEFVPPHELRPVYLREPTFVKAPPHRLAAGPSS
jgi:tRNA threonylcarbamoyl adenosine modification protein YeaZ